jgi:crossover junction endodeoxyribonuclease RuvC
MRVLGVDPGLSGAIALFDTTLATVVVHDMPVLSRGALRTKRGLRKRHEISEAMLADLVQELDPNVAFIERVHALPGQGVSSSFTFGVAYGVVRGVLAALDIPVHLITPNEWKRVMRLGADKSAARAHAIRLLPASAAQFQRVKDDGRAEAALLACFGAGYKP